MILPAVPSDYAQLYLCESRNTVGWHFQCKKKNPRYAETTYGGLVAIESQR